MLTSACNKVFQLYQRSAALIINTGHPTKRPIALPGRAAFATVNTADSRRIGAIPDQSGDYSLVFDGQYKRIISAI